MAAAHQTGSSLAVFALAAFLAACSAHGEAATGHDSGAVDGAGPSREGGINAGNDAATCGVDASPEGGCTAVLATDETYYRGSVTVLGTYVYWAAGGGGPGTHMSRVSVTGGPVLTLSSQTGEWFSDQRKQRLLRSFPRRVLRLRRGQRAAVGGSRNDVVREQSKFRSSRASVTRTSPPIRTPSTGAIRVLRGP